MGQTGNTQRRNKKYTYNNIKSESKKYISCIYMYSGTLLFHNKKNK